MILLCFLTDLYKVLDPKRESDLSFIRSLHRCGPLWKRLWKLIQVPHPTYADVHVDCIFGLASRCIELKTTNKTLKREERASLVRTWLRNGIFDALDTTLPQDFPFCNEARTSASRALSIYNGISFDVICGLTVTIGTIISEMYEVLNQPGVLHSTLPTLRRQLPRPRILLTLLRFANLKESDNPRLKDFPGYAARHVAMATCVWRMWYALEKVSLVHRQCIRRGCTNRSMFRCKACQDTEYCSFECQSTCVQDRLLCFLSVWWHDLASLSCPM